MSADKRIYTVPLGKAWIGKRWKRAEIAVSVLKRFANRHMKPTELIIDQRVNEAIWARGIQNPPRKIRVRMEKDGEGVVTIYLAEGGELE